MLGNTEHMDDPERGLGESVPLEELVGESRETSSVALEAPSGSESDLSEGHDSYSDGPSQSAAPNKRTDFDDGANALWSLYGKEAQAHDETLFQSLSADMDGVPTFVRISPRVQRRLEVNLPANPQAGLFAAVLTSFLVNSLQNLQPDPAQQAVYYHQQSVAMLAQISQQIASIAPQVSIPSTPPPPYPAFHISISDIRVNAL
ncbi:hypothetical protein EI94DRAFT_1808061 [Lactarius quietus]|nr:hypothetical protein EI94DRAFT_1808061 [Lactarius quietus]